MTAVAIISFGSEVPISVEPGGGLFHPSIDCAKCAAPVQQQKVRTNAGGGLSVFVRCHGSTDHDFFEWGDTHGGDLLVGPAFDPALPLVRRR